MAKILVVDDEENIRKTVKEILEDEGHDVQCAEDGEQGLRAFVEDGADVVLMDIQMPKKDGLALLSEIKGQPLDSEVIMISGHGTIEAAVRAIKAGAYHFLQKPLSMIEVKQIVRHAADAKQQRDELRQFHQRDDDKYRIIGRSPAVEKIMSEVKKVAPTTGRVLITGESGTGKELIAYAIHKLSQRAGEAFVKVNCAAIPENLIESELFGHEKGSFTGAINTKRGKFELADKGTLFLDEIGDMDMSTQTKVLRAIQEGEFERVGGTRTIMVDVRIVAATHRDLLKMIEESKFRQDLYYRLNVVPLKMPLLSQRREDIPLLADYFLDTYCRENGTVKKRFSPDAMALLMSHSYPGNIRELKNIVERQAIMSGGIEITAKETGSMMEIKPDRFGDIFTKAMPLSQAQDEMEREYVRTQLELNCWDIPKTAEILGIQRTNLHRKIRQLGIEKK
jgi:two-component system, NtrC family, nitrogen regulation response regulator NtrX